MLWYKNTAQIKFQFYHLTILNYKEFVDKLGFQNSWRMNLVWRETNTVKELQQNQLCKCVTSGLKCKASHSAGSKRKVITWLSTLIGPQESYSSPNQHSPEQTPN